MIQTGPIFEQKKSRSIDIQFVNVSYAVRVGFRKRKKEILKGVSGRFRSGQLTAIMGPSGAGKTSLFHILTGFRRETVPGEISYLGADDRPVSFDEYRKSLRYIQQEDKLYPTFTVIEVMRIAAELKLDSGLTRSAKELTIEETMKTFDLARVRNVRCEMLSGGQRKRLCIAVELLDNPKVVFLDEPTTGLDSSLSSECVKTLKTLAQGRRTIVCVIHQPSAAIYEVFDHVYFLAEGRCVYQGLPQETVPYFRDFNLCCPIYHNPADYVVEVISNEYGSFIAELEYAAKLNGNWTEAEVQVKEVDEEDDDHQQQCSPETEICVFEVSKFTVLLKRSITQLLRDSSAVQMKIGLSVVLGLLLGAVFYNSGNDGKTFNNVRFLLCSTVFMSYTTLMPAVLKFPLEVPVLQKEHFNKWYHIRTYFAAVNTVNIPFQVLLTLIYCTIAYWLTGQPMEISRFAMFVLVGILTSLSAESMGFLLGTLFDPINGTFMGAATLGVMISLTGVLPLFQHMPGYMYPVTYLSFLRYSLEAMVISVYGYGRLKLPCDPETDYCHYRYPKYMLNELRMQESMFWPNVGALAVNFIVFRLLACWALKRRLAST